VIEGINAHRLTEAFGCGTAVVITAIGSIGYRDQRHQISDGKIGPISQQLYQKIIGLQQGVIDDTFGWTREVQRL